MKDCIVDDKYGRDTNVTKADYLDVSKWRIKNSFTSTSKRSGPTTPR